MPDFKWPEEMTLIKFACCSCKKEFWKEVDASEKPTCSHCFGESKHHEWLDSMTYVPFTVEGILRAIVAQMKKR